MRHLLARTCLAGMALWLGGCLGDFATPSAYQSQVYDCDDSARSDLEAAYMNCHSDLTCFGYLSMRGTLDGKELRFSSPLSDSSLGLVQPEGSPDRYYDILRMTGESPYFQFVLHLNSIGGQVGPDLAPTLNLDGGARTQPSPLADLELDGGVTLQVGGQSQEKAGITDSGSFIFTKLSATESRASFHGSFGTSTDQIEGCFIVAPKLTAINPAPL